MIDPPEYLGVFRRGDDGVLPTATDGEWGQPAATDYEAPLARQPRMWDVTDVRSLTAPSAGSAPIDATITAKDRPEYWLVAASNVASTETLIWTTDGATGDPVRLGPNGYAKLAGLGYSITLRAAGATPSNLTVVAVRGYPDATIQRG